MLAMSKKSCIRKLSSLSLVRSSLERLGKPSQSQPCLRARTGGGPGVWKRSLLHVRQFGPPKTATMSPDPARALSCATKA
eukprot:1936104-Amphidinium_carterae.1